MNKKKDLIIRSLVEEERKRINLNEIEQVMDSQVGELLLEDELGFVKQEEETCSEDEENVVKKRRKKENNEGKILPVMTKDHVNQFLATLNSVPPKKDRMLKDCLLKMHATSNIPWTTPSFILKAVRHAVLNRKWNNLTHLLLMLIEQRDPKYKAVVRHFCAILERFHPTVQEHGLQEQFRTVHEVRDKALVNNAFRNGKLRKSRS